MQTISLQLNTIKHDLSITDDKYITTEYGTLPFFAYQILKERTITLDCLEINSFPFIRKGREFHPKRKADEDYLSETDKECLELGIKQYATLTFEEVKEENHKILVNWFTH